MPFAPISMKIPRKSSLWRRRRYVYETDTLPETAEEKAEKFDALSALLVEKGILTQEEMDGLMAKTDETEGKV